MTHSMEVAVISSDKGVRVTVRDGDDIVKRAELSAGVMDYLWASFADPAVKEAFFVEDDTRAYLSNVHTSLRGRHWTRI